MLYPGYGFDPAPFGQSGLAVIGVAARREFSGKINVAILSQGLQILSYSGSSVQYALTGIAETCRAA